MFGDRGFGERPRTGIPVMAGLGLAILGIWFLTAMIFMHEEEKQK